MKMALLDDEVISAEKALIFRQRTGRKGYIYACPECGEPARLHGKSGQDGHFEHKTRVKGCSLSHIAR